MPVCKIIFLSLQLSDQISKCFRSCQLEGTKGYFSNQLHFAFMLVIPQDKYAVLVPLFYEVLHEFVVVKVEVGRIQAEVDQVFIESFHKNGVFVYFLSVCDNGPKLGCNCLLFNEFDAVNGYQLLLLPKFQEGIMNIGNKCDTDFSFNQLGKGRTEIKLLHYLLRTLLFFLFASSSLSLILFGFFNQVCLCIFLFLHVGSHPIGSSS